MNLAPAKAARDADFTKLTTTNGNHSTQLRQKKNQIQALQERLCNQKVASATRPFNVKTKETGKTYARDKNPKPQ